MGVQGLTALIETQPSIFRDVKFRRSRLLIDGCNLQYLLYFSSGLDQNHGGDYAMFEALIERFIRALAACQIEPYVVLDGGSDYTDKKLETVTQRARDRIRRADRAAVGGGREQILPQLAKQVFKQTLVRLKVPVAQCYFEADQEIAALANEWYCPVLSNDSDFYVFPLPAGLLPISHFRWEAVEQSGSRSYIPCKNYNTRSFCIVFDLRDQLLPAFAALAGNDYVKLQRMESSISWAQFAPAGSERPSTLGGLIHWLRRFHKPEEAFEAALGLLGELDRKRKAELLEGLYLGMEGYQIQPSSLGKFFIHGTAPPFPAVEKLAGLVPDWTRLPLTQARLTADVLDVLLLQRMSLSFPVEPEYLPSAHLTSRPLRQLMYGLLLGKGRPVQVEERDREGLQLKVIPVQPAFRGAARQLALSSLHQAEVSQRLQVLLEALGVTEDSLRRVPPQLRLPVAVTCYWMQKAQPPPSEGLMRALLLGASNGDALRRRRAVIKREQKLDVRALHAFNQWQACLKHSIHLNQLLGLPLPEPQVARLFEGTLVHHLYQLMRTKALKPFLKHDRCSVKQYKCMLAAVHRVCSQKPAAPSEAQKASAPAAERRPLGDLAADFQRLFLRCDDGDEDAATEVKSIVRANEDVLLDDMMAVRTRYRVKDRNNRCSNVELARKDECRGRGAF